MNIARVILAWGALLICGAGHALAQETSQPSLQPSLSSSIQLRASAATETLDAITLGDVAAVEGAGAESLAKIAIPEAAWFADANGGRTLDIAAVRRLLSDTKGVNLGRIALSGQRVEWRQKVAQPPPAPPRPSLQGDDAGGVRVRDLLHDRVATALGVAPTDLRVSLDEGDAEILNTSVEGRTVTITPMGESDRPPLAVRVYEGDRLIAARSTRVGVLLRRQVVLAARDIRRGELLDPSLLLTEERWLAPSIDAATLEDAAGKSARGAIEAGAIITNRDAEEPIVVRKGERIVVDCMVNGVLVRNTMRAGAQARIGDVIVVESLTSERGERRGEATQKPSTVFARVSAAGQAVVTTSQPTTRPASQETLLERVNRPRPLNQNDSGTPSSARATTARATTPEPAPFTVRRGGIEVTRVGGTPVESRKEAP